MSSSQNDHHDNVDYGPENISVDSYRVSDTYFGKLYINQYEIRERPSPTALSMVALRIPTPAAFYFSKAPSYYCRLFQPLEGGHGGNEVTFGGGVLGEMSQRNAFDERIGGYDDH